MSDELNKGIAKRGQKHSELPLTTASLRQELLEAAGFDRDAQIEIMCEVVEGAREAMKADKETPGFFMGKLESVHRQPDHGARAKARDQLVDIIGASGKAASIQHDKGPRPEIPLPPWMLNMTFNGTQAPSMILEGAPIGDTDTPKLDSIITNDEDISHL
jgi:hypothetical protein